MTAEALHLLQRYKRPLQPFDRFDCACPTEVAGAYGAQKVEADISGRGTMRNDRLRIFLEIVRRQHLIVRCHERLEVPPRASSDEPQVMRVVVGYGQTPRNQGRNADPLCD